MPYYRSVGTVPRKRHVLAFHPDGQGRLHEELVGLEGFAQESALLYHLRSPSAVRTVEAVEPVDAGPLELVPDRPLQPRHLRTGSLSPGGDVVAGRQPLLGNDDLLISWVVADRSSGLYRDAMGDQLLFVHAGAGVMESVFGRLPVRKGDYVVVPAGTTHRWAVEQTMSALVVEARGHVTVPARYLSQRGQLLEGAPFSERDFRGPGELVLEEAADVPVLVRNAAGLTRHVHATHPFDVVGWDGCLYPYAFNIGDFEPIVGAVHQPPPVHQTFAGPNFVVCSFVPRPYDFRPGAVKVPYHHANVDSDEVLFYADGDFMSRAGSGISAGSVSYHPAGFVHGPQPGSVERSLDAERTEEVAVMIDAFRPLRLSRAAREVADPDYYRSWLGEA